MEQVSRGPNDRGTIDFLRGYDIGQKALELERSLSRLEAAVRTDESCKRTFVLPKATWEDLEKKYRDIHEHFKGYGVTLNGEFERLTKSMDALRKYVPAENKS